MCKGKKAVDLARYEYAYLNLDGSGVGELYHKGEKIPRLQTVSIHAKTNTTRRYPCEVTAVQISLFDGHPVSDIKNI